jgi:pilus assembly protein CpaC
MTLAALTIAFAVAAGPVPPHLPLGAVTQLRIDRSVGAATELALEAGQNRLLIISEEIGRVAVANPQVADLKVVTPNQLLLTAKGAGTTDLTLWNRNNEPLVVALQVSKNLEPLRKQVKELFPGEKVTIAATGELVVLSGEVSDVRIPERIVEIARLHAGQVANLIKVAGVQQVQIEIRFAEVSRSGLRQIGVNLFHKARDRDLVAGMTGRGVSPGAFLNTIQNPSIPGAGESLGHLPFGQPPDVYQPQFNSGFSLFLSSFPEFPFSAMLSLLQSNGLAKVLAEPTLVTLSGQQARFLAGGELPIPLSSSFGQIQVEWKKFGILLDFTPTVIAGDTIHLDLQAEVSEIDQSLAITIGGTTIPGLSSRQSQTTVRLGDGQSFAIAGLVSDRVRSQIEKVPLLGSLPILGALFRSTQFRREESELLVVVTARLARPVAPHELPPLPTEREINHPSDLELFLLGSDGSTPAPERTAARTVEGGPAGARGFVR